MILKFITKVRRNTKRASASMLPVALMFILMMVVLTNYIYRRQMLQYNYESVENSLVDALLASSVVNLVELNKNGNIVIDTATTGVSTKSCFDNSYDIFRDVLKSNLHLSDTWQFDGVRDFKGELHINEFSVYNVYKVPNGFQVVKVTKADTGMTSYVYPVNQKVYVYANGVDKEITQTSVFAQITFDVHLMNRISWMESLTDDMMTGTYSLRRLVAITDR